ncbi:MAG: phosphoglycerate kinase [Candidatus Harrisonbacteria bacterium]|nr:phosphoglycerate kinase [Candidatus Harrisonbacteria bacterium]
MTYLVRVDFNVESAKDALRLEASLPTIEQLLRKGGAKVVILSHRGRPDGKNNSKLSLKEFLPFLRHHLRQKVVFLKKIPEKLPAGRIFLLENLRFWPGEEKNDLQFAKKLARLGDRYINDAFAVSHRKNASITQLPTLLPSSMGLLLKKEIGVLSKVMKKPKRPLVLIFGGSKIEDKLPVIKYLLPKTNKVLLGSSILNNSKIPKSSKLVRPIDWVGEKKWAYDVGPLTIIEYKEVIRRAKTVIWNGPIGNFENPKYAAGSIALAHIIAASKAFSVAGGGETTQLIKHLGLEKKIDFLSTGGGAMLEMLAGKKLPGVEILKKHV